MKKSNTRRLVMEGLENRAMLAADIHNLFDPLDTNADGRIAPSDALMVIDHLNLRETLSSLNSTLNGYWDVNDDGILTPSDALEVIDWLHDRVSSNLSSVTDWLMTAGEDASRVGVRVNQIIEGGIEMVVQLQHAAANQLRDVFLEDSWIGTIHTDALGRGSLHIDSSNDFVDRMTELLIEGRNTASLVVDGVAQFQLNNLGSSNPAWSAANWNILESGVYTAQLSQEGQSRGNVLFGKSGQYEFLGVYARGLTPEESYDIIIDEVVVASAVANSVGVIATRIYTDQIEDFPQIGSGSTIQVAGYNGTFSSLKNRLQLPTSLYVASLTGNLVFGVANVRATNDHVVMGLQLFGAKPNTTYPLFVDDVKIADVTSGPFGALMFNYDSSKDDTPMEDVPMIGNNSLIRVGDLARGRLLKIV